MGNLIEWSVNKYIERERTHNKWTWEDMERINNNKDYQKKYEEIEKKMEGCYEKWREENR